MNGTHSCQCCALLCAENRSWNCDDPCRGHVRGTDAIQVALLSYQPWTSLPLLLAAIIPLKLKPIVSINSFCPLLLFGFLYPQ